MFGYKKIKKKRVESIKRYALKQDFHWEETNKNFLKPLKSFRLMKTKGELSNLIVPKMSNQQHRIKFFDYFFMVSTGTAFVSFYQTVFYVKLTDNTLPNFFLHQKTGWNKLVDFVTGANRRSPVRNQQFNRTYKLKSKAPKPELAKMFSTDLVDFCVKDQQVNIEYRDQMLIFYRLNKLVEPTAISQSIETFEFVLKALKQ